MAGFDAVLLLSFGGPEGPDDVLPFLQNVTRGRDVPPERLEEVADQYARFGGVSPINDQARALQVALAAELARRRRDVPVYWGNRNWTPYVEDAMGRISEDGHRNVLVLTTSAYSSYSACRQYLEDVDRAVAAVREAGGVPPEAVKIRPYWNHPGFVLATVERVHAAIESLDPGDRNRARLVFTAHSLPRSMAETSDYELQLRDVSDAVAERVAVARAGDWELVYQSRSGPPRVPWLEPDVCEHLRSMRRRGDEIVVVVPIGFTSDHMEVVFDLDVQAAEAASEAGLTMVRAATVGTHPLFVRGLGDLLDEHLVGGPVKALGTLGPRPTPCAEGCCPPPVRARR